MLRVPSNAVLARSTFQPQRVQNGLFAPLKKRRNGTCEPQRGQVMLLITYILSELSPSFFGASQPLALFENGLALLERERFLLGAE